MSNATDHPTSTAELDPFDERSDRGWHIAGGPVAKRCTVSLNGQVVPYVTRVTIEADADGDWVTATLTVCNVKFDLAVDRIRTETLPPEHEAPAAPPAPEAAA